MCSCGWQLPMQVAPFAYGKNPAPGQELYGVYSALRCPVCDMAHLYMVETDPGAQAELERQRREWHDPGAPS